MMDPSGPGEIRDMVYFGDETGKVEYLALEKIGKTKPYTIHISKGDAKLKPCQTAVEIKQRKFGQKPEFKKVDIEDIELTKI